jgi:hypothetical protein
MRDQIEFDGLMDRLNSNIWCDLGERPRLRIALKTLCQRMPVDVYDELPIIILFAPAPWKNAAGFPVPKSWDEEAAIIYVNPRLEEESQEQNNFTLAHEFAHVSLRHHTYEAMSIGGLTDADEDAADALVKWWGYEIPAYRTKAAGASRSKQRERHQKVRWGTSRRSKSCLIWGSAVERFDDIAATVK